MRSLTSFPGQRTVGTNADWIQRNQIMWLRRAVARFDFTQHDVCVDVHRPCNRTSVHLFSARSCTQYGPVVNTRHGGSRSDDDPSKSPIDRAEIASRLVTPLTVLNSLQKKSRFFIAKDIRATKEYGNRRLSCVYSCCLTSNVLFEVLDGLSAPGILNRATRSSKLVWIFLSDLIARPVRCRNTGFCEYCTANVSKSHVTDLYEVFFGFSLNGELKEMEAVKTNLKSTERNCERRKL